MTTTIGISTTSTHANRSSKNVSGGANGKPNLAATKPVLQMITKSHGINGSHGLGAGKAVSNTGWVIWFINFSFSCR
jgi:hypothetical protein